MDARSPIILIGGGRSGSTLVMRLLNAHGEIDFKGETNFLVARLWLELWGDRFWLYWPRQLECGITSSAQPVPMLDAQVLDRQRARAGGLCADLVRGVLEVRPDAIHWGFKEPWNGSCAHHYEWDSYHHVFPGARWVHLTRHPFAFARSCAQWNEVSLTRRYLTERLADWVDMLAYNRRAANREALFEIRFEDVVSDPQATLAPLLHALGAQWQPAMSGILTRRAMASNPSSQVSADVLDKDAIADLIGQIPGLDEAMAEMRYVPPTEYALDSAGSAAVFSDWNDPEQETVGWFHPVRARLAATRTELAQVESDLSATRSGLEQMRKRLQEIEANRLYTVLRWIYRQPVIGPFLASRLRRNS